MRSPRAVSGLIVAALRKKVDEIGGAAMILAKGDPDAGGILAILAEKGTYVGFMERRTGFDGGTSWDVRWNIADHDYSKMLQLRKKSDPDIWIIELDIVDAERFADEIRLIC